MEDKETDRESREKLDVTTNANVTQRLSPLLIKNTIMDAEGYPLESAATLQLI